MYLAEVERSGSLEPGACARHAWRDSTPHRPFPHGGAQAFRAWGRSTRDRCGSCAYAPFHRGKFAPGRHGVHRPGRNDWRRTLVSCRYIVARPKLHKSLASPRVQRGPGPSATTSGTPPTSFTGLTLSCAHLPEARLLLPGSGGDGCVRTRRDWPVPLSGGSARGLVRVASRGSHPPKSTHRSAKSAS